MNDRAVHSCIYEGTVRHRRFAVRPHAFDYKVFMMLVDVAEVEAVTRRSWLWSFNRPNLASFRDSDFLATYSGALKQKADAALQAAGRPLADKVYLLANWRYFGYIINPISCFYCYNNRGELETLIVEVTNTPWKERQVYVLPCAAGQKIQQLEFAKAMHVSPFFGMDMSYRLRCNEPLEQLSLHLENWQQGDKVFDATLALARKPVSGGTLALSLLRYPLMTLQVFAGIHWQALKLYLKKVPVFTHPAKAMKGRG